jgi:ornithine carbamoyltransferase
LHLIGTDDLSKDAINRILDIAEDIAAGKSVASVKEHSTLGLLFELPSTRTHVSFDVAMARLGGHSVYLDTNVSQMSRGESIADTARVLSGYCDFIAARVKKHQSVVELAENSRVPVINALSDLEHPTQALADAFTIRSHKVNLGNIKIAFMGDVAQNTANSIMLTAAKLGADVALIGPKGFYPNSVYVNRAMEYTKVVHTTSLEDGLEDADVVYTDTYVSMGKESEAEKRRKLFAPYQLNSSALKYANKDAIVMHPLPAHRGEEITDDVIDGKQSVVWEQSRNKMIVNQAILVYLSQNH